MNARIASNQLQLFYVTKVIKYTAVRRDVYKRQPFKEAVIKARDMGAKGLQPYVIEGELAPQNLSKDDRKSLLKYVLENGLVFSALCADFNMDFGAADNQAQIQRTMEMMDLAVDLGCLLYTSRCV